ncbi:MAG: hypothetical protein NTW82_09015 [Bacteroidia bacterium]|nr:hypothetical protein [Bacteroidia bacterium]
MKKIVTFLMLIAITIIAHCQDKDNIQIRIPDYKENDTIILEDLLNMEYIFLCNKNYLIISFVLVYTYGNNDFMMISKSNKLTDDMKKRLIGFESMNVKFLKISFKAITVETSLKEQIKTGPQLKYTLRIK